LASAAQHRPEVRHETPNSAALAWPAGSASTFGDHVLPFQCSAMGSCLLVPSAAAPTARLLDVLAQDTPLRTAPFKAAPGLAATRHREPFQRSIRMLVTPAARWPPTAQHSPARGQATPFGATTPAERFVSEGRADQEQ